MREYHLLRLKPLYHNRSLHRLFATTFLPCPKGRAVTPHTLKVAESPVRKDPE